MVKNLQAMKILFISLFILVSSTSWAQTKQTRTIASARKTTEITIDGKVNPDEWKGASVFTDFVELRPNPGRKEAEVHKTIAYLLYDDEGIYFGGTAFEATPDSISKELVGRDGFGNNDFVGVIFDTYKDNLNAFEYFVTPLNEQFDAKQAPNPNGDSEDFSWNAVWESATSIHEQGWSFELFIPFSSIRFPDKAVQDWGINIVRRRQISGQQVFWNEINPTANGFLTQEGYVTGFTNIKPPIRLQLSPYVSYYTNHYPSSDPKISSFTTQFNGGMDLKWGINQAFTLDATLIPDFGQVQSDARIDNLSPFEVRYNENRSFFTEGTELFNKGNLFYSRRIGGAPINYYSVYDQVGANEELISNPSESKLFNASKISGRTESGLGIGILNAVTSSTYAVIEDTLTGGHRKIETDPLTNYNVFILNKSLKNNSSVSFVNTSVLRSGQFYDANVAAIMFDLNNEANTYGGGGQFNTSQHFNDPTNANDFGYSHSIYFGKTSGKFRYNFWQDLADKKFSSNDLGYYTNNNYMVQGVWIGLSDQKPNAWRNNINVNINMSYNRLLRPIGDGNPMFKSKQINVNINGQHTSLAWFGLNSNINFAENDFYEPRLEGSYFRRGASALIGTWFETNSNKAYSINPEIFYRHYFNFYNSSALDLELGQNWRVTQKFSIKLNLEYKPRWNNVGFSSFSDLDKPIFANRDVHTYETSIKSKFNFTNRMGITLVGRHYASTIKNKQLFDLEKNGRLTKNNSNPSANNRTLNFFNLDVVYTWQIAQGSFVNLVWKYSINRFDDYYKADYFANLKDTFRENQNNNISLRIIYFLDYNTIRGPKKT